MHQRNSDEYKLIRDEMVNLKDCITKYLGYLFAGSGIMIFGVGKFVLSPQNNAGMDYSQIAVIGALLSMLITLFLSIMFYKFNSHNRFAGFCKLLNYEKHFAFTPSGSESKAPLYSWEINVGELRGLEANPEKLDNIFASMKKYEEAEMHLGTELEKIRTLANRYLNAPKINIKIFGEQVWEVIILLFSALIQAKSKSNSWGFPPLVTCIGFFLVIGSSLISILSYCLAPKTPDNAVVIVIVLASAIAQLLIWVMFTLKLYALMFGNATVMAYCRKLMPLRMLFLLEHGLVGKYKIEEEQDKNS